MSHMRVIVTGANGFIGKRLVETLSHVWDVVEVDKNNMWELLQWEILEWNDVECIFHLGAISDTTSTDPMMVNSHNVNYTISLFMLAASKGIPVKYASSASVYGMCQDTFNPLNFYALSKLTVDYWVQQHLADFSHIQGFRFFNVYGPGEEDKVERGQASPISTFAHQAKTEGKIKLFEGSDQYHRDFVHVDDVIHAMLDNNKDSGIYDLGTSVPISFEDVGRLVADKFKVPIEYIPFPEHLRGKYQEFTKAKKEGWPVNFRSVRSYVKNDFVS